MLSECRKRVSCYCHSCRTLNRETSFVLCPYLNNTSVLCPRCPYSLRTLSVVSTRSPCCLRGWTSVLSCHPYSVRYVRTLTVLHPSLSAGNLGQFVHPLLHPYWLRTLSVLSPLISANLNKIPYCLRTLYAKFRPYSIRSDRQHPCVGVKGALMTSDKMLVTALSVTQHELMPIGPFQVK